MSDYGLDILEHFKANLQITQMKKINVYIFFRIKNKYKIVTLLQVT